MRFLISIFVVSALALLPAITYACPAENPEYLGIYHDTQLPQESDEYTVDPEQCGHVSILWEFDRTDLEDGRTIVWADIVGTTLIESIDSREYDEGDNQQKEAFGTVSSSSNTIRMRLDKTHDYTGHFENMEIWATYSK